MIKKLKGPPLLLRIPRRRGNLTERKVELAIQFLLRLEMG